LRYWAVTSSKSDLADKVVYHHETALERVAENAAHFAGKAEEILCSYHADSDQNGILVAPYDAELFGHWWFEGPLFLKEVLRHAHQSDNIELTFLAEHLDRCQPTRVVSMPEGSWGQGNHHYIWINRHTEWTWKHIYECEAKMCELARYWGDNPDKRDHDLEEILKQLARQLMLLSSSDWQFLISTWAARDYAETRLSDHYEMFCRIAETADKKIKGEEISDGEWQFFNDCCEQDRLFPELEIEWFARVEYPV